MVALLCQGQPALEASAIDAPRADGVANFTIDTLRRLQLELKAQQPSANPEIFVLVGADAFLGLRRWRDPDALLTLAEWIVVSRPGFDRERIGDLQLASAQLRRVHWLDGVAEPASGTAIREALRNGEDPGALLPPGVLTYIRTHRLYQAPAV
jgi:nicotinate-nucleotide adenylyltransferase